MCEVSNFMKHLIRQVALSIPHLFSDGDRASQPEGGGGGVGQRGGAADVLHPARPARRRRRPHPCSVSRLNSLTFTQTQVALDLEVLILFTFT